MSTSRTDIKLGIHTSNLLNIAGVVVWVYDCCITLDTEVHLIWGKRWNIARATFTLARYMPLINSGITVYSAKANGSGNCHPLHIVHSLVHTLSIVAAEALLVLRTYKFWDNSRLLLLWVAVLGISLAVVGAVLTLQFGNAPLGNDTADLDNCILITGRMNAVGYGCLLLHELVLSVLIISSSMTTAVYRRSMSYICCIVLITLLNLVMNAAASAAYMMVFSMLQIAIQSALSSRVLFDSLLNIEPRHPYTRDSEGHT